MYNVKIIITNQNSVKNTTAEFFSRYAKFCSTFCNTFEFCNNFFAILSYFAILFTILEKNYNTFCNT